MRKQIGSLGLRRWVRLAGGAVGAGMIALAGGWSSTGAIAQVLVPVGTESATLSQQGLQFEGTTGSEYNLMRLARRDRRRRLCLGYGNEKPDHVLVLSNEANRLSVSVMSDGDTTLLIDGPRGVDCNDNARRNSRDAAVQDETWPAGTYRVWVGSFQRGDRLDYKLLVSESEDDR